MKKRTMNEYRQTKEHYVPKERVKRNVPRHPKSYEDPVKQIMAQQIDEEIINKDEEPVESDFKALKKRIDSKLEEAYKIPEEIKEITLNEQMQEIAGIVAPTIHDVIFNEIIEVMDNYDELNWGYFVQDDAPTALLDACFDHKTEIHYEIFQLVLQKLK